MDRHGRVCALAAEPLTSARPRLAPEPADDRSNAAPRAHRRHPRPLVPRRVAAPLRARRRARGRGAQALRQGLRAPHGTADNAFTDEFVDLDRRLAGWTRQGVDVHALSLTTPMVYWASPAFGLALAQAFNDAASAAHAASSRALRRAGDAADAGAGARAERARARVEAPRHARHVSRHERQRRRARRQAVLGRLREGRGARLAGIPASGRHHRPRADRQLLPAEPARQPVRHRRRGRIADLRRRARCFPAARGEPAARRRCASRG